MNVFQKHCTFKFFFNKFIKQISLYYMTKVTRDCIVTHRTSARHRGGDGFGSQPELRHS